MSQTFQNIPGGGGAESFASFSVFPTTAPNGTLAVALDTGNLFVFNANTGQWQLVGSSSSFLYTPDPSLTVDDIGKLLMDDGSNTAKVYQNSASTVLGSLGTFGAQGNTPVVPHPSLSYLVVTDTNNNTINSYSINSGTGTATLVTSLSTSGANPGKSIFNAAGTFVFVPILNDGTIDSYSFNVSTGQLLFVDTSSDPRSGFSDNSVGLWSIAVHGLTGTVYGFYNQGGGTAAFVSWWTTSAGSFTFGNFVTGPGSSVGPTAYTDYNPIVHGGLYYIQSYSTNPTGSISSYSINQSTGTLTIINNQTIDSNVMVAAPHPSLNYVYVVCRDSITEVAMLSLTAGTLGAPVYVSIDNNPSPDGNAPLISSDGLFLYTGTDANTIIGFSINQLNGTLTQIQEYNPGTVGPFYLSLSTNVTTLFSEDSGGNYYSSKRDTGTGLLSSTGVLASAGGQNYHVIQIGNYYYSTSSGIDGVLGFFLASSIAGSLPLGKFIAFSGLLIEILTPSNQSFETSLDVTQNQLLTGADDGQVRPFLLGADTYAVGFAQTNQLTGTQVTLNWAPLNPSDYTPPYPWSIDQALLRISNSIKMNIGVIP